ncbi:hypothetical protein [Paenibacillus pinihumi]|uniref:hypothetical protein n=1 Tax=Paenibacillus pinihumi TaxID=669462 RepID=UPI000684AB83|nr:hypothetical protein [Paenibacillus pinihumi]
MLFQHKKKLYCGFILLFIIAILYYFFIYSSYKGIVESHTSYIGYDNANHLVDSSELIIIATPVKDFVDREHSVTTYGVGAVQDYFTKTELKIEEVLKGDLDEDYLTVIEPISYIQSFVGKRKITTAGYTEMEKGHRYMIALKKNSFGDYGVINMKNGVFDLNEHTISNTPSSNHNDLHETIKSDMKKIFNL